MGVIFVTGKSGSGKSTFSKLLADRLNYNYVSVDSISHSVYDVEGVLEKAEELFGGCIFDENGVFDRKKLGKIFFSENNSKKVQEFSDFTWAIMLKVINEKMKENVVIDWILSPVTELWDNDGIKILVKAYDEEVRLNKILSRDNISKEYLLNREKCAPSYNESEFDFIVENSYLDGELESKTDEVADKIKNKVVFSVLGCESPFCKSEGACPSYLIESGEDRILLDCGSGSHRFYDFDKLNGLNIFLSHLHKDHFNDVFNYQYGALVLNNHGKMNKSVNIYLPDYESDIAKIIRDEESEFCSCHAINEDSKIKVGDFEITFLKVEHSKSVTTYAIKLIKKDLVIVYSADLSFSNLERFSEFAYGCDLLVCESSLLTSHGFDEICSHLTASQAAKIASRAKVKKLLLTHFWPDEDKSNYLFEAKSNFEKVEVAKGGKKIYLF